MNFVDHAQSFSLVLLAIGVVLQGRTIRLMAQALARHLDEHADPEP